MASAQALLPRFRSASLARSYRYSHQARLQKDEVHVSSTATPIDFSAPHLGLEQPQPGLLPYFVQRTASGNLPIYVVKKGGGNLSLTRLRRISGDVKALRDDLKAHLGLPDPEININWTNQLIYTKGDHRQRIHDFLQSKTF